MFYWNDKTEMLAHMTLISIYMLLITSLMIVEIYMRAIKMIEINGFLERFTRNLIFIASDVHENI